MKHINYRFTGFKLFIKMNVKYICLTAILLFGSSFAYSQQEDYTLGASEFSSCAIVCSQNNDIESFAALELQKHLKLITGVSFPIVKAPDNYKKVFYVGIIPSSDQENLKAEEARYLITSKAIYLYGEDNIRVPMQNATQTAINVNQNRTGTLFAVYNFLENELAVHWFEPGDGGIVYSNMNTIKLKTKSNSWISHFLYQRGMRSYMLDYKAFKKYDKAIPEAFKMTEEQVAEKRTETEIWLKRMRMGNRSAYLSFSHSFTDWWEKFGKTHPEWFALNSAGVRGPMGDADGVKMCVSNDSLVAKKVELYKLKENANHSGGVILCSENDGGGFGLGEYCHCPRCMALDQLKPGEKFGANLTDRYVNLWNRVGALGRKTEPDLIVTGYAYADMITPPRKERLSDALAIEFVTSFGDDWKKTRSIYEGWVKMGCKQLLFRPNDLCCDLGLPLGQEERVYQHQQLAVQYNALGTDHDALFGFWTGVSGINYYILGKSHVDPSKSFDYWENEYYSMFGEAKEDVRQFYQYWRNEVFTKRLFTADIKIKETGGAGLLDYEGIGAVGREVNKYYSENDFNLTDGFLQIALKKKLSPVQKKLIDRLIIANQNNRLTFEAMQANHPSSKLDATKASKSLLDFRIAHKNDLYMNWPLLFMKQVDFGDICGMGSLTLANRKKDFDCVKIESAPIIDGKLDEAFWGKADTQTPFLIMPSGANPTAQTKTYLAYNNNSLFIAFRCNEPKIDQVRESITNRDGEVWGDNAIEMFFDPNKTGSDYFQLIISSNGTMFDGSSKDGKYDAGFNLETGKQVKYAIYKGTDYWSMEVEIPFAADLIPKPVSGSSINFNLCRDRSVKDGLGNEKTSLAALFASFQTPGKFNTIIFK
jgi:hypothetical protein